MKIINLTPHTLNIHTETDVREIPPSGEVARVTETRTQQRAVGDIPVDLVTFSTETVTGLPAPADDTIYVVSSLVLAAVPNRPDVFAPGAAVRDTENKIIGCKGLSCTPAYAVQPDPAAWYIRTETVKIDGETKPRSIETFVPTASSGWDTKEYKYRNDSWNFIGSGFCPAPPMAYVSDRHVIHVAVEKYNSEYEFNAAVTASGIEQPAGIKDSGILWVGASPDNDDDMILRI